MNIFAKLGHAFHNFWAGLFGADADKALAVIEANSPLVQAAKPVVADLQRLVPDTHIAVELAREQVKTVLTKHFTFAEVETWMESNLGLGVPQLLQAAAAYAVSSFKIGNTGRSAINLAIEFALQLIRTV